MVDCDFILFFVLLKPLFLLGWTSPSSLGNTPWFWGNCENICGTWVQHSATKQSFDFLFLALIVVNSLEFR